MEEKESLLIDEITPFDSKETKSIRRCMKTLNEKSQQNGGGSGHSGHLLLKSSRNGEFSPFWVVLDPSEGYVTTYSSQEVKKNTHNDNK